MLTASLGRIPGRSWRWLTQERHRQQLRTAQAYIKQQFTEHPRETQETYLQHLWFTLRLTARILFCGTALLLHGVFPFLLKRTTSRQMQRIYTILRGRMPKPPEGSDSGF